MRTIEHYIVATALAFSAGAALAAEPLQDVVARLTAPPTIVPAAGFAATVPVPPGQLYDPLVLREVNGALWFNDDGGEEGEHGSRLLALDAKDKLTIVADIGRLLPTVGFDIAPQGFGSDAGKVFSIAQPKVAMEGAVVNHLVQRLDPQHDFAATNVCTLPEAGPKKTAAFGLDARFGLAGSPFANRLFVLTIHNGAIYEVTAAGKCTPFVVFDGSQYSAPTLITFTPDGSRMLVAVSQGSYDITSTAPPQGAIVTVGPDGSVDAKPLWAGQGRPMGMEYAPAGFGKYAGELFFADTGFWQIPVPMTQAVKADGRILRLTKDGKTELVASGLNNPAGLRFYNGKLVVTDTNGDFIAGKRELPDGYVVEIVPR